MTATKQTPDQADLCLQRKQAAKNRKYYMTAGSPARPPARFARTAGRLDLYGRWQRQSKAHGRRLSEQSQLMAITHISAKQGAIRGIYAPARWRRRLNLRCERFSSGRMASPCPSACVRRRKIQEAVGTAPSARKHAALRRRRRRR